MKTIETYAAQLEAMELQPLISLGNKRAAFLGCGDSLAAARPAEELGHRVLSAGDIAWSGKAPAGVDAVVALSWSGKTGATINAAKIAKQAGLEVIAMTTNPRSPLAELADHHVLLPTFTEREDVPALGYAAHSAAVWELCTGTRIELSNLATTWRKTEDHIKELVEKSGPLPQGITVATMPDAHGTGEFLMLKLIEATGLSVRWTAIEEIGHVDYFIGPQAHLTILVSGVTDAERAVGLGQALKRNGHHIVHFDLDTLTSAHNTERQVVGGLVSATYSDHLAAHWGRPLFRNHEVDMSASHIQVPII